MSFADELRRFSEKAEANAARVFVRASEIVEESIKLGSPITGAPGQPVDTGYLRNSWIREQREPFVSEITTNVSYAPAIEDNSPGSFDPSGVDRPANLKSQSSGKHIKSTVGGPHSVKLTRAAWERIVETAVSEVVGNG